ncbi:MAG: hypothetical protein OXP69_08165 [Spirochaetaceae bacterium]|nr:hypothetical protein [Spirochaetaceae bacterium]
MTWGRGVAWGVFGAWLALVSGCSGGAAEEQGAVVGWQVQRSDGADGAALAVRLDRDRITTAEWLALEVEVHAAEGRAVRLPASAELEAGSLRVERMQTEPPELVEDGTVRWLRRFELQPFLAGDYAVPALQVAVAGAPAAAGDAGEETWLTSEPIPVTVVSVIDPSEAAPRPREVADPVAVAPRTAQIVLLAAAGLGVAGAAAGAAFWWRRRAARIRAREALVPPHEAALRALQELAAGDLPERDPLAFHHAVADILRRYLEQRFAVRAPERTTEELMLIAADADWLDNVQRHALHAFLASCDQVKFAGARPPAAAARGLIDKASDLVTALRLVPAEESEEDAVAV